MSLRKNALRVLLEPDPDHKASLARALDVNEPVGATEAIAEPSGIPGRPARPQLLPHTELKQRSMRTLEGRAALIHA
ncbi:MAG TPA: DUF455 domain-containing protein, partial [Ramlibacter sp.]|nr:DUF455 domain-containing protein [Ramlibacter sp.]